MGRCRLLAFLPNALVLECGWPVHLALWVMCALAVVAMGLGAFCPRQAEYLDTAAKVLGQSSLKPAKLKDNVCDTLDVVRQKSAVHAVFAFFFISVSTFWMYYGSVMFAW